jgi:hypothetical protein
VTPEFQKATSARQPATKPQAPANSRATAVSPFFLARFNFLLLGGSVLFSVFCSIGQHPEQIGCQ